MSNKIDILTLYIIKYTMNKGKKRKDNKINYYKEVDQNKKEKKNKKKRQTGFQSSLFKANHRQTCNCVHNVLKSTKESTAKKKKK